MSPQLNQVSQTGNNLPAYTVYSVKNVTCSHSDNGRKVAEMSCLQGPGTPDFNLSVEVVVKVMQKISGRSWCLLGFSNPLCGQELAPLSCRLGWDRIGLSLWNSGNLMTHGYRVRVNTTGPSWILPGTLTLEHANGAHLSHLPVPCPCQQQWHQTRILGRAR